jgi:hypothetical protein
MSADLGKDLLSEENISEVPVRVDREGRGHSGK